MGESGFDSLYLGSDETTVLREISQVLHPPGYQGPLYFLPQVLLTVDGVLTDMLDLTDQSVLTALGVDVQTLTGNWTYTRGSGAAAPTQLFGRALFEQGTVVGLKYPSSKNAKGFGLVVFADRLAGTQSWLEVHDPNGTLRQRLP